ncbi:MBL fold metallo-hydrolase [Picrophilus oshimae]|uniref:Metal dependent hydrolase n=1 Tax=Picrophilus torridus (strain ATCC 700027 / DSM 9790 / JCM 10055 / NBRC 100828 / KAW 2/3) TaxID=1122961 RepID=Q6KZZ3_PICTO|nr:MBL fold metallo-hydrolase [Picrophilus oshimae]AAT43709.1 metal dependent hydrolase [Picrophilus oshimae DSM 9789]
MELYILNDGSYTIDAGAFLGITPKKLWSQYFNDENNRIRISLNVPVLIDDDLSIMIDAGMGSVFDDRFKKIFEPVKNYDLASSLIDLGVNSIDYIILSHMHFDHSGHIFDDGPFKNSRIIVSREEINAYYHVNEFTRGSYIKRRLKKEIIYNKRFNGIHIIKTGGHTAGHRIVWFQLNGEKYIYFGDLVPTPFHLKPAYIPGVDCYPLETLKMKKDLIKMAIDKKMIAIFDHDPEVPMARLSGNVSNPKYEELF